MDRDIKVIALGGLDEYGKSCYAIEIEGDIFVIEAGVKFPDKMTPGINYMIARFDYLFINRDRVVAYIISHGHDEVMGALPYFYRKVPAPVYCSDVTQLMIRKFMQHNRLDFDIDFRSVKSGDSIMIAGRKVSFFAQSHNIPQTLGVSIYTDYGNIIYSSSFIINNNIESQFTSDRSSLVNILAENKTLLFMCDSHYAERKGYAAPNHDISFLAEDTFRNSKGRIFAGILSPDIYTIYKFIQLAIKFKRKLIPYDEETKDLFFSVAGIAKYKIPEQCQGHRDDVNRYNPNEVLVVMTGYGTKLYSDICLLANGQNDDKRFFLNPTDTYIYGSRADNETEIDYTESLDELYKANVHVTYFKKHSFIRMHPCQEDIKSYIRSTKPQYYMPVNGNYSKLIANAMTAVNMDCGLNFSNIFVVDDGSIINIHDGIARLSRETVMSGDLFVDGTALAQGNTQIMDERTQLGDNGVVTITCAFSKTYRNVTFGPDVQTKGLVFASENDQLIRDIKKLFIATLNDEVRKPAYSIEYIKENAKEVIFRHIRRVTQRTPIIIVSIYEVE